MEQRKGFVKVSHDEFDGRVTTTHAGELRFGGNVLTFKNNLRRVVNGSDDRLLLDCDVLSRSGWPLEKLEILADGVRHDLRFVVHDNEVLSNKVHNHQVSGVFRISTKILLQLASSQDLKARFVSRAKYYQLDDEWINSFSLHCKQFYNNVYDQSLFIEAVSGVSPVQEEEERKSSLERRSTELAELSTKRNIWLAAFLTLPVAIFFLGALILGHIDDWPDWFWAFQILVLVLLCAQWVIPQSRISEIREQISKECPKCNREAIKLRATDREFHGVRSEEKLVYNRLTNQNESKQVTVTDYKVTKNYECSHCFHKWSHSYIE